MVCKDESHCDLVDDKHSKVINKINAPNMGTLREKYFFHPCAHIIGLQKGMTVISGLLTIVKKN